MPGPGEYVADRTEGITRVEDLPKAKVVPRSRNVLRRPCPECGRSCYRHRTIQRTLHDLGNLVAQRPRDLRLTYSQHYCCKCHRYFNVDTSDLAPPKSHYTHRVIALAVRLVVLVVLWVPMMATVSVGMMSRSSRSASTMNTATSGPSGSA